MKPKYTSLLWGLTGSLLLASAAIASVTESQEHLGSFNHKSTNYINFREIAGTGDSWPPTYTFTAAHPGVKAYEYEFSLASGGICFEVETLDATGGSQPNNDTRFWVKNGNAYSGLNDDKNGAANRYSKARVYLGGNTSMTLFAAAYSSDWNTMTFAYTATRLNKNEADCTTNSTLPWVKSKNSVLSFGGGAF
ncbi:MAG TPA: hypothetical protein VJ385_19770 [Fibrobacteria bacterium]|nr:hypothetical protein [Fibrobacteria bacterium]